MNISRALEPWAYLKADFTRKSDSSFSSYQKPTVPKDGPPSHQDNQVCYPKLSPCQIQSSGCYRSWKEKL